MRTLLPLRRFAPFIAALLVLVLTASSCPAERSAVPDAPATWDESRWDEATWQ